jgi:hypothetical protein
MPTHLLPAHTPTQIERREATAALDRFVESVRRLEEFVEHGPQADKAQPSLERDAQHQARR